MDTYDDETMFAMFECKYILEDGTAFLKDGRRIGLIAPVAQRLIEKRKAVYREQKMRTEVIQDLKEQGWKSQVEVDYMKKCFKRKIEDLTFERTLDRAFRIFMGIVIGVLVYLLIQHW